MFETLDAEQAGPMLLKNIAPVLNFGGISLPLNESVTETTEQAAPAFGGSLTQTKHVTVIEVRSGRSAGIEIRTETDPASMKRFMEMLATRFPAKDAAARERNARELEQADQLRVTSFSTATIDLKSGLPLRFEHNSEAGTDVSAPGSRLLIEWLK